MRKILFFGFAMLLLSGCRHDDIDYYHLHYSYYPWVNNSDHTIELTLSGAELFSGGDPVSGYKNDRDGFEVVLEPGESHIDFYSELDQFMPPFSTHLWKMRVLFDDEYSVEFSYRFDADNGRAFLPEGYDANHNLADFANYTDQEVKNPEGCRDCHGTRWTYTFTNNDFEVAKAWAESEL